jgi:hypothetical protein
MRFRPANIRLINRRPNLPRLLLALSSENDKNNDKNKNNDNPTDSQRLTGSLHIRAFPPVTVNRIRHESAVFGKTAWRPVASMDTIREDALIGLAHPAFCDQLTADAKAAYPI